MEKRRLGRTDHMSTIGIFGGAAFWDVSQDQADETMELVIQSGINHLDVAPQYGVAEEVLGPWLDKERQKFFLGCKTMERSQSAAWEELERSLLRLRVSDLDLYQLHAITSIGELDQVTKPGGALETLIAARDQGITRFLGITGHGIDAPDVFIEALSRFDFDCVMFPLNFILYANRAYRESTEQLLQICRKKDIGVMIIKSIARGPYPTLEKSHTTWYLPFSSQVMIQKSVNFTLSQPVTGLCLAGDVKLTPKLIKACQDFAPISREEQQELLESADQYKNLFT
jgi:predicted aldo/keto reductase-like oxidoreductase